LDRVLEVAEGERDGIAGIVAVERDNLGELQQIHGRSHGLVRATCFDTM
jgi:hypothetical protein